MIGAQTKQLVRSRYVMRCGYCGVTETQTGAKLTYDHFRPRDADGTDNADTRLLHPLNDDLMSHLHEAPDGKLVGDTALGNLYIERLYLNRVPLVAHRAEQIAERVSAAERIAAATALARIVHELGRSKRKRRRPQ